MIRNCTRFLRRQIMKKNGCWWAPFTCAARRVFTVSDSVSVRAIYTPRDRRYALRKISNTVTASDDGEVGDLYYI